MTQTNANIKLNQFLQAQTKPKDTAGTTKKTEQQELWSVLGPAACINLANRPDRMARAQEVFDGVGLDVYFHRVERSPRGGRWGCYESHRDIIRAAYKQGLERIIVFEDDVAFKDGWEDYIRQAADFIMSGEEFDALYLGHETLYAVGRVGNAFNVKPQYMHAYVVSRAGMESFISQEQFIDNKVANLDATHDHVIISVWTKIIVPAMVSPIVQEDDLGSSVEWLEEFPPEYREWFQMRVIRPFMFYQTLMLAWSIILPSLIRPAALTLTCPIDDGKVRISSNGMLKDILVVLLLIAFVPGALIRTPPPGSLFGFLTALLAASWTYMTRSIKTDAGNKTKKSA